MKILSLVGVIAALHASIASALPSVHALREADSFGLSSRTLEPTGNLTAGQFKTFEQYLSMGLRTSFQGAVGRYQLHFIEAKPFERGKSKDSRQFVKMKINAIDASGPKTFEFFTWNWNAQTARELEDWRPVQSISSADRAQLAHLKTISPQDVSMTMSQAFGKLYGAGRTNTWAGVVIGKFVNPPPLHSDDVFFAFWDPSQHPQYTYVECSSNTVIDDDSPFDIGHSTSSLEGTSGSNTTLPVDS